jgi:hypothetical protein
MAITVTAKIVVAHVLVMAGLRNGLSECGATLTDVGHSYPPQH